MTIAERMVATDNRSTGFDYLRVGLAVFIVCWHSIETSYGMAAAGTAPPFVTALVPMFFTVSGFLVAGSLERCRTIGMFLGLRVLRIFPALASVTLLLALVVGPLMSTLPFADYVSSPAFHRYFLNIVGMPQYELPGLFENNPEHQVNGSLWTIPFELECYAAIALFALIGLVRNRQIVLWGTAVFFVLRFIIGAIRHPHDLWAAGGVLPGWLLIVSFLCGLAIYLYRDKVPWSRTWGLLALALGVILLALPLGRFAGFAPLAYATVCLGLTNPPKVAILRSGDYSYGIYVYAYPVQQVFASLGPWAHHWWLNILVCVPASTMVAAVSWHLVEKPALGLRKPLKALEDHWLVARGKLTLRPAE